MSTFQKCIQKDAYDKVSPGEVCTIETAVRLGIYDTQNYFKDTEDTKDIATYNDEKDSKENRTGELCSYTSNARFAYESCTLQHGIGFARRLSDPSKCMTVSCPSGFETAGSSCKKPLVDLTVSTLSRCDERWHDWFLTPNYHLGNKHFAPKPGQCYKPCPEYHVPQYATDPVDEASAGINAKEKLDRCVARDEYMSGKYESGSDFCPLAWIHRLSSTPTKLREKYLQVLDESLKNSNGVKNDYFTQQQSKATAVGEEVTREAHQLLENITPPTDTMIQACRTLNTADRLNEAHDVCSRLEKDETWYTDMLEAELNMDEPKRLNKVKMLKQACNAIFCNPMDNSNEEIGKPQVCFVTKGEVETSPDEEPKDADPPYVDSGKKIVNKSVGLAATIIFIGVFGVIFILFMIYFLWPYVILPTVRFIYNLFARYKMKRNKIQEIQAELSA
jgi:hypothetical protein